MAEVRIWRVLGKPCGASLNWCWLVSEFTCSKLIQEIYQLNHTSQLSGYFKNHINQKWGLKGICLLIMLGDFNILRLKKWQMILDRNQLVWFAFAEFYIAEIRTLFWEKDQHSNLIYCEPNSSAKRPAHLSLITVSASCSAHSPALVIYPLVCLLSFPHLLHRDSTPRGNLVDVLYSCPFGPYKRWRNVPLARSPQCAGGPQHFLGVS